MDGGSTRAPAFGGDQPLPDDLTTSGGSSLDEGAVQDYLEEREESLKGRLAQVQYLIEAVEQGEELPNEVLEGIMDFATTIDP